MKRMSQYAALFNWVVLLFTVIPSAGALWGNHSGGGYTEQLTSPPRLAERDSIQAVLSKLSLTHPNMVSYIPETQRLYLNVANRSALSDELVEQLQIAFYYDISQLCKLYGVKYLADWRALIGKAARESFWGTSYLSNRTFNYFGIWRKNKPWVCNSFRLCDDLLRDDPSPAEFIIFPDFESCLWMFIHTMYSDHFTERLPDWGMRIVEAIEFERSYGIHYWESAPDGSTFSVQLQGTLYTAEELIYTWSEHPKFNLCLQCNRQSDRAWVSKVENAETRMRD